MKYRFLSVAETELEDLLLWYDRQQPGLGDRFYEDVEIAIERIKCNPEAWRPLGDGQRRIMLRVFQAGLVYRIENDEILITTIIDLRSDPENWRGILNKKS